MFLKGRLIDQLLPISVNNPEEASIVRQFRLSRGSRCPYLQEEQYNYATVWGNTLPLWKDVKYKIFNLLKIEYLLGKFKSN